MLHQHSQIPNPTCYSRKSVLTLVELSAHLQAKQQSVVQNTVSIVFVYLMLIVLPVLAISNLFRDFKTEIFMFVSMSNLKQSAGLFFIIE